MSAFDEMVHRRALVAALRRRPTTDAELRDQIANDLKALRVAKHDAAAAGGKALKAKRESNPYSTQAEDIWLRLFDEERPKARTDEAAWRRVAERALEVAKESEPELGRELVKGWSRIRERCRLRRT